MVWKVLKAKSGTKTTVSATKTSYNSSLAYLPFVHVWLFHTSIRKQIDWGLSSPLKEVRSSKHFKAGDLERVYAHFQRTIKAEWESQHTLALRRQVSLELLLPGKQREIKHRETLTKTHVSSLLNTLAIHW